MIDLAKALREEAAAAGHPEWSAMMRCAADEMDHLRAELANSMRLLSQYSRLLGMYEKYEAQMSTILGVGAPENPDDDEDEEEKKKKKLDDDDDEEDDEEGEEKHDDGDPYYCACPVDYDEEESAAGICKGCGKQILGLKR